MNTNIDADVLSNPRKFLECIKARMNVDNKKIAEELRPFLKNPKDFHKLPGLIQATKKDLNCY